MSDVEIHECWCHNAVDDQEDYDSYRDYFETHSWEGCYPECPQAKVSFDYDHTKGRIRLVSEVEWNDFENIRFKMWHIRIWPVMTFRCWGIAVIKHKGTKFK